jgi:hypothetical protein
MHTQGWSLTKHTQTRFQGECREATKYDIIYFKWWKD